MKTSDRPLRFAVALAGAKSRREWHDKIRRVADSGFDALHVPDHFGVDYLSTSSALATVTTLHPELHITSLVYDNDFRHPAVLAQEAAALAILSEGRFELGVGAGWLKTEYDRTGIPWHPGRQRVDRLTEALEIITPLLRGEEVTFRGRHYQVEGLQISAPSQPPRILIGGGGARMLGLAARHADIVSVMPRALPAGGLDDDDLSSARFSEKITRLTSLAGERELEIHALIQAVVVTNDREAGIDQLAREWDLPAGFIVDVPLVLIGSTEEVAEQVLERRRRYGFTYFTVFEEAMEDFTPVVERLKRA